MEYWNSYYGYSSGYDLEDSAWPSTVPPEYSYSSATHFRVPSDYEGWPSPKKSVFTTANKRSAMTWDHPVPESETSTSPEGGVSSPVNTEGAASSDPDVAVVESGKRFKFRYTLKIINPSTENAPDAEQLEFGYIEPGHGLRGRKEWINTGDDLSEMLEKHKGKNEVMLWCYTTNPHLQEEKKRSRSRSPAASKNSSKKPGASRYDNHLKKATEVDEIFDKLDEAHKGKYSPEQLRMWSHLIQLKKHDSFELPPDKPFFTGRKRSSVPTVPNTPERKVSESATPTTGISPGRRVNLRTQCIDQLQKWHVLLESGAISKDQYEEFQQTILSDMKTFF